jgi:NAD(P)H dehydrogenase (quinone)
MRVLVVFAHPKDDSFNAALLDELVEGLLEAGHETDVADLYAEGFDPALRSNEWGRMGLGDPGPVVRVYQERLRAAEGLAFVFPVWWFGPPAMIKGFVDRVFTENFAFRFTDSGMVEGLLAHSKALVLNTAGASEAAYLAFGFHKPLNKTFCDWTLRLCGVKEVRQVLLKGMTRADEATRGRYLLEARGLGRKYFG